MRGFFYVSSPKVKCAFDCAVYRVGHIGHQIDVTILDFSKAFDTVPHKRLLGKLKLYGISGEVHKWISNFLVGRKQSVMVDGARSEERQVKSGVPQGTVLGPLLFLLHINDIVTAIDPNTKCRLFADDYILYRVVRSVQDQVQLQVDLKNLEKWATTWGMRFNASKCYVRQEDDLHVRALRNNARECDAGEVPWGPDLERPLLGAPYQECCLFSQPKARLHEEKPEGQPKRTEETCLHHNSEI